MKIINTSIFIIASVFQRQPIEEKLLYHKKKEIKSNIRREYDTSRLTVFHLYIYNFILFEVNILLFFWISQDLFHI